MSIDLYIQQAFDPTPLPGLGFKNFRKICDNGFGDGYNSFAHSMAWFNNHLYVGTTRANFCMAKVQERTIRRAADIAIWPIESPDDIESIYKLDRRAHIWRYNPLTQNWQQVMRSPRVMGIKGAEVDRDVGYRGMAVFQGESDPQPVLYVSTWAASRAPGSRLLRSEDGKNFTVISQPGIIGIPIPSTRVLVPFKGRLFMSPTGGAAGNANKAVAPTIYETHDPVKGEWQAASLPGFGEPENQGIFMVCPFKDRIYAGTFNCEGFQIWSSNCEGNPPYKWTKVIDKGAYRGSLNQIAICMSAFKDALYVGTGIQGCGIDTENNIGPAASELIRIFPDGKWDLIVGKSRNTPDGVKKPLSGLPPGFGNFFNGYFWRSAVHDGWLYVGTCNMFSLMLPWLSLQRWSMQSRRLVEQVGVENIVNSQSGFELWRSCDGENWLPVNKRGFGNPYNIGVRSLVSTPYGLFLGTANPFGPRVAVRQNGQWIYADNPLGGLEVWLGCN
ncbi:hypothetical protein H6S82_19915 [Planktothrix sp. FACHB-1355]|uniref:Uncharacterized protein n=1 Tax=Aerosakkonema funiforme FACHB-1375 TaxID=2949571 RepID=A0A926ZHN6_9CYAN|nr:MULTISPECIES: hypothetical protein [Oscillatoriales]MBD2183260.1 hypothetical protein [Aerosakkonema funiforme FACHB-1375]MBD3561100.1 hypothetical protein [Planktothrix sp. FACHB-1355]